MCYVYELHLNKIHLLLNYARGNKKYNYFIYIHSQIVFEFLSITIMKLIPFCIFFIKTYCKVIWFNLNRLNKNIFSWYWLYSIALYNHRMHTYIYRYLLLPILFLYLTKYADFLYLLAYYIHAIIIKTNYRHSINNTSIDKITVHIFYFNLF